MRKQSNVGGGNPIGEVAAVASASAKRVPKPNDFLFNDEEVRAIFQQSLSRASNQQCVSVDSLYKTFHQFPNKLAFTSSVIRQGLDQFQKVLLSQDNTTGLLSEEDFVRGLHRFEDIINAADIRDEILQEIEALAVNISGNDSSNFSDLLHLPDILNEPEVEGIMKSMDGNAILNEKRDLSAASAPNRNNSNYLNTTYPPHSLTTPSPTGKITSASIKRVSLLSSTTAR
jgi:hypothetical protein